MFHVRALRTARRTARRAAPRGTAYNMARDGSTNIVLQGVVDGKKRKNKARKSLFDDDNDNASPPDGAAVAALKPPAGALKIKKKKIPNCDGSYTVDDVFVGNDDLRRDVEAMMPTWYNAARVYRMGIMSKESEGLKARPKSEQIDPDCIVDKDGCRFQPVYQWGQLREEHKKATPFDPVITKLVDLVENITGQRANSVLIAPCTDPTCSG